MIESSLSNIFAVMSCFLRSHMNRIQNDDRHWYVITFFTCHVRRGEKKIQSNLWKSPYDPNIFVFLQCSQNCNLFSYSDDALRHFCVVTNEFISIVELSHGIWVMPFSISHATRMNSLEVATFHFYSESVVRCVCRWNIKENCRWLKSVETCL